jgi:hypothetical protein
MKLVSGPGLVLVLLAVACAPSKDIESPADPPGIENEDGSKQSGQSGEASVEAEAEAGEPGDD